MRLRTYKVFDIREQRRWLETKISKRCPQFVMWNAVAIYGIYSSTKRLRISVYEKGGYVCVQVICRKKQVVKK